MLIPGAMLAFVLGVLPAQDRPATAQAQPAIQPSSTDLVDIGDLIRKLRHKPRTPEEQAESLDPTHPAYTIAPVIGFKPASGVIGGMAGNIAVLRGDAATTHMSSLVSSATFSSKKQTSLTARFDVYGSGDRWVLDGDNRAQWTSQNTFGLGTTSSPDQSVNMRFDRFRFYETAYIKVYRRLLGGLGFHYSTNTNIEPGEDAGAGWDASPYVTYTSEHGFPADGQTSAGIGFNLQADTRDHPISARRGWLAVTSYRTFFRSFLGGDSSWQELYLDARTYKSLDAGGRQALAFWFWGDLVTGGVAPYLDLPATGMDKYGRSGRGYAEGRFRGERLVYGEVEYRRTLTANGLIGMVAFVNTTSVTNRATGERLFDDFGTGAGGGVRVLLNKKSKTNLCMDFAWGRQGSNGFYLSVQEAF